MFSQFSYLPHVSVFFFFSLSYRLSRGALLKYTVTKNLIDYFSSRLKVIFPVPFFFFVCLVQVGMIVADEKKIKVFVWIVSPHGNRTGSLACFLHINFIPCQKRECLDFGQRKCDKKKVKLFLFFVIFALLLLCLTKV